ncbi:MAG: hypothetical protein WCP55_07040 [Lentisphaerota bacterium]
MTISNLRKRISSILVASLCCFLAAHSIAAQEQAKFQHPVLRIPKLVAPPVIDGRIAADIGRGWWSYATYADR